MRKKILNFWRRIYSESNDAQKKINKYIGLTITDNGENNVIQVETPGIFTACHIHIDANNTFINIKKSKYLRNVNISVYNGDNQTLVIGNDTSIEGMSVFLCGEHSSFVIENNCMLANNIQIWTGDGHSVIDKDSKRILNATPGCVKIGEHSWLGQDVKLLKKAHIPKNSIVGASSVISKNFEKEYTVIAGNPAQVVKKNVLWHRDDPQVLKGKVCNEENND